MSSRAGTHPDLPEEAGEGHLLRAGLLAGHEQGEVSEVAVLKIHLIAPESKGAEQAQCQESPGVPMPAHGHRVPAAHSPAGPAMGATVAGGKQLGEAGWWRREEPGVMTAAGLCRREQDQGGEGLSWSHAPMPPPCSGCLLQRAWERGRVLTRQGGDIALMAGPRIPRGELQRNSKLGVWPLKLVEQGQEELGGCRHLQREKADDPKSTQRETERERGERQRRCVGLGLLGSVGRALQHGHHVRHAMPAQH